MVGMCLSHCTRLYIAHYGGHVSRSLHCRVSATENKDYHIILLLCWWYISFHKVLCFSCTALNDIKFLSATATCGKLHSTTSLNPSLICLGHCWSLQIHVSCEFHVIIYCCLVLWWPFTCPGRSCVIAVTTFTYIILIIPFTSELSHIHMLLHVIE